MLLVNKIVAYAFFVICFSSSGVLANTEQNAQPPLAVEQNAAEDTSSQVSVLLSGEQPQRKSGGDADNDNQLLAEVLAAGINAGHAMQMLEHHAELLGTIYTIGGGLLALLLGGLGWLGFGRAMDRITEMKTELSESVDIRLQAAQRLADRDHEQMKVVLDWYRGGRQGDTSTHCAVEGRP